MSSSTQHSDRPNLPRPDQLLSLLERLDEDRINMHGLMVSHCPPEGPAETLFEGYWAPYDADSKHRMYSVSKSITATAIGFLVAEGKLALSDPIATFFPDCCPDPLDPLIAEMTVRDLLMMATGREGIGYSPATPDWLTPFFNIPPRWLPGSIFRYDTSGSNVLAALVERLSGEEWTDYLRPRLFEPLGLSSDIRCVRAPDGAIPFAGSGILCTLRDLTRIAQFWMQGGRIDGRQCLPEDFVREATSRQIAVEAQGFAKQGEVTGYGYQIWTLREGGFAFFGMGSQLALCYPQQQLLVTTIADTQTRAEGSERIIQLVRDCLLRESTKREDATAALAQRCEELKMRLPEGALDSPWLERVAGRTYECVVPVGGIRQLRLERGDEGELRLSYLRDDDWRELRVGMGQHLRQPFTEQHYSGMAIGQPAGRGFDCLVTGSWIEPHKLQVLIQSIDIHLGMLTMTLAFDGERLSLDSQKSAEWFFDDFVGIGYAVRA